jgi:hypothetical protein
MSVDLAGSIPYLVLISLPLVHAHRVGHPAMRLMLRPICRPSGVSVPLLVRSMLVVTRSVVVTLFVSIVPSRCVVGCVFMPE